MKNDIGRIAYRTTNNVWPVKVIILNEDYLYYTMKVLEGIDSVDAGKIIQVTIPRFHINFAFKENPKKEFII